MGGKETRVTCLRLLLSHINRLNGEVADVTIRASTTAWPAFVGSSSVTAGRTTSYAFCKKTEKSYGCIHSKKNRQSPIFFSFIHGAARSLLPPVRRLIHGVFFLRDVSQMVQTGLFVIYHIIYKQTK